MAKTILYTVLVSLVTIFAGCNGYNSGSGQIVPKQTNLNIEPRPIMKASSSTETDIIEQVAVNRQAYKKGLEELAKYYKRTGNHLKLQWVNKELKSLYSAAQYNYIIEANLAGPNLRATDSLQDADDLYYQGSVIQNRAKKMVIFKNKNKLRLALDCYNRLIKEYPSSDKIGLAAYKAGTIYEKLKDYTIAVLYYQRSYQWDSQLGRPAKYRAAFLLDQKLSRRYEALSLYHDAVKDPSITEAQKEFAELRIAELSRSGERLKEIK